MTPERTKVPVPVFVRLSAAAPLITPDMVKGLVLSCSQVWAAPNATPTEIADPASGESMVNPQAALVGVSVKASVPTVNAVVVLRKVRQAMFCPARFWLVGVFPKLVKITLTPAAGTPLFQFVPVFQL